MIRLDPLLVGVVAVIAATMLATLIVTILRGVTRGKAVAEILKSMAEVVAFLVAAWWHLYSKSDLMFHHPSIGQPQICRAIV